MRSFCSSYQQSFRMTCGPVFNTRVWYLTHLLLPHDERTKHSKISVSGFKAHILWTILRFIILMRSSVSMQKCDCMNNHFTKLNLADHISSSSYFQRLALFIIIVGSNYLTLFCQTDILTSVLFILCSFLFGDTSQEFQNFFSTCGQILKAFEDVNVIRKIHWSQ